MTKEDEELAATITARVNAEIEAAEVPGSGAARRMEAYAAVSKQLVAQGIYEFRQDEHPDADYAARFGRTTMYIHGDPDVVERRLNELMEAAGLRRLDA
jgi:hypothetical protein